MALPPADLPADVLVALGCLAVPGALVLGALTARLGHRSPGGVRLGWISPTAGLLLLALVAVDLVPDVLEKSAALDPPPLPGALLVVLPAVSTLVLASVVLWRPAASGCCSRATGLVTATVLVCHGTLEGFVVGLGVGVGPAAGLGLLGLFACHRFAEGFALGATLHPATPRTRGLLVALAAVTPLVGGDAGLLAGPGPRLSVVVTAALTGLLGAAGVRLLIGPSVTVAAASRGRDAAVLQASVVGS